MAELVSQLQKFIRFYEEDVKPQAQRSASKNLGLAGESAGRSQLASAATTDSSGDSAMAAWRRPEKPRGASVDVSALLHTHQAALEGAIVEVQSL